MIYFLLNGGLEKEIDWFVVSQRIFVSRTFSSKSLKACLLKILYVFPKLLALNEIESHQGFYHWQRSLNEQVTLPKHLRHLFPLQEMTQFPTMYRMSNSVIAPTKKAVLPAWWGFTLNLAYSQLDFSYKLIEDLPFATDYFILYIH